MFALYSTDGDFHALLSLHLDERDMKNKVRYEMRDVPKSMLYGIKVANYKMARLIEAGANS